VFRSWSPASTSTGTAGRSRPAGNGTTGVAGHCSQTATWPLPVAVARSNGKNAESGSAAAAAATSAARPATGLAAPLHGPIVSWQVVAACRPALSSPAVAREPLIVAATIRSSSV
jgi:hypothetical protein